MGTWNTKPFGNDAAGDWLWQLEKAKDETVIKTALTPDADAEAAIAAAAVVEAARRQPLGKLPPIARKWVSERGFVPTDVLVRQAIAAVERIKTHSELRELWAESKSLAQWLEQAELLLAGLREVRSQPAPARKPKAPAPPRLLHKLIEQINPEEECTLRKRLREKLEAVEEVNALIKGTVMKNNLLCLLAAQGLVPEAKRLVERGAHVNPNAKTHNDPLLAACSHGHVEMARLLIDHGAEIYRETTTRKRLADGKFANQVVRQPVALFRAAISGGIPTIELLVQYGAELSAVDGNNQNLLHKAAECGQVEMVEYLAKKGVALEAKNDPGFTPLLLAVNMAASIDRIKTVEKLLLLGANPNAKDNDGNTALDLASGWPYPDNEVVELVKMHGGMRKFEMGGM